MTWTLCSYQLYYSNTDTLWFCSTSPFFLNYSTSGYSRLGRSPKVNFPELLWQNFYRSNAHPVTNKQHQSTEGWQWVTSLFDLAFRWAFCWAKVRSKTRLKSTRKPSCRWQTHATLTKSLHSLRKSSGVVSCIASLPIDSVPMVSYYILYSNCVYTRKPSCRWQTRATLVKSSHGLRKSSGVVSCIARLPIDSLPMVSYYVLYSNCL